MIISETKRVLTVVLGLSLIAGLALAQEGQGAGRRIRRGDGPPAGMARPEPGGANPLSRLIQADAVEARTRNTDNGVDVILTSESAEAVEQLQRRAAAVVERLNQARGRMGGRGGERNFQGRPGRGNRPEGAGRGAGFGPPERAGRPGAGRRGPAFGILPLLIRGDLELEAHNRDNGVVLRFTTGDAELVKQLQEGVAEWIEQGGEGNREGGAGAMRQMVQILGQEGVDVEVRERDAGVSVSVTSRNPEVAARIREILPRYFEQLQQMARRMGQAGERPGDRGYRNRAEGPPRDGFGPRRGRSGEGRFGPPPPEL